MTRSVKVAAAAIGFGLALAAGSANALTVLGTDVIYAAGGNASAASAGGTDPVELSASSGAQFTFSVTGSVVLNLTSGNNSNDADGVGAAVAQSNNFGSGSISGILAPNAGYLVGVFVPTGGPSGQAPASIDFQMFRTNFTSLSPQLDQVFFIGDGLTGDGVGSIQTFIAPSGAGALYLGISDACSYYGSPGCYGDNAGSFSVVPHEVTAAPEASTWAMMLIGFAGLGFAGYRASRQNFTMSL